MTAPPKRCAVYTRKSTEAGLEQDFNSLHAQREASIAYIQSQKHEGWQFVADEYDDGGFSGGSMDRPALRRLLADVAAGKINVIVVYKVDRLTRSLADFAKIIELLDKHGASFVSVTQQFNTTTSMGRLTLNVLLSFAQFEREVTSERIRDKVAASKKKGLWMGGTPPLGYDIADRRLVVNEGEATTVRTVFSTYLEVSSVTELCRKINLLGLRTKSWTSSSGRVILGAEFTRGRLYHLLKNPVYIGLTQHKDSTYPGHHEAIVPMDLWNLVQARLKEQWGERSSDTNRKSACWLVGLLSDDQGNQFCSTQTKKNGRMYYYYASQRSDTEAADRGWSLPAKEIEGVIVSGFIEALRDPLRILDLLGICEVTATTLTAAIESLRQLETILRESPDLLRSALHAGRISRSQVELDIRVADLAKLMSLPLPPAMTDQHEPDPRTRTITIPVQLRRRGVEARLVIEGGGHPTAAVRDPKLVRLVARAHAWFEQLKSGRRSSVDEIAKADKVNPDEVSRVLPLAFLAPSIIEAILAGTQPPELTATRLRRIATLPSNWVEQRRVLGFPASA